MTLSRFPLSHVQLMGDETAASSVQQNEKGLLMLHNARSAKISRSSGFLGPGGPANADFLREQQEKFERDHPHHLGGESPQTKPDSWAKSTTRQPLLPPLHFAALSQQLPVVEAPRVDEANDAGSAAESLQMLIGHNTGYLEHLTPVRL